MANLTAFSVGQSITGIQVDTTKSVSDVVSVLSQLTYEGGQDGMANLLAMGDYIMTAMKQPNEQGGTMYAIVVVPRGGGESDMLPIFISETIPDFATEGWNNLIGGVVDVNIGAITTIEQGSIWNDGTIFGAVVAEPSSLTPFSIGQTVTGIDFGNVSNGETSPAMDSFLAGIDYGDGNGIALLEKNDSGEPREYLVAMKQDGILALMVGETLLYINQDVQGFASAGFNNLTNGKYVDSSVEIATVSAETGWNGILVGAVVEGGDEPVDTVTAGTYSAATGIWTDNADYEIADNGDGTYDVTGLIPYGRADSLFAYPGYRFAVKISRDSITSRDDLPDGNICTVTVGSETTTYTKSAFETDGSIIYIAAPVSETLATPRVVKIAWSIAGSTVEESDFTSYTFDLSGAELAPIPEETEDESRVAYCITPKITSDKFVKVVAPSGGLRAGQVVNCVSLASSVAGVPLNLEVYSPSLPTTATLDSRFYCLIVNGGFEKLEDGRRPSGNPDYTTYVYNEGDVCQGILLDKNLVFEISGSCISGDTSLDPSADIGRYIVPVNGTYVLSIANAPTAGGCLKIIGTAQFRKGGILNDAFVSTYIALAIH